jgi:hypothetical protein
LSTGETSSTSRRSSPGPSRIPFESDAQDGLESVQLPIHVVQPQAKTMTIPGIHASHRGEIMSMGYSAPQPQHEGKPSVYRLWKSPPLSGQERVVPPTYQSQDPSQNTDADSRERDRDTAVLVPTANSPPHAPPRPVPPPLPPRSTPVAVSRPPLETSSSSSTESSASQSLKSIANKDERQRASFENGIVSPNVNVDHLVSSGSSNLDYSPTKTPSPESISITNPGPPLPPRR